LSILTSLRVHGFRNLAEQTITLEPGINLFSGANGQGKTNCLEAVFFLALLRSFRTSRINHLVQWEANDFAVDGTLLDETGPAFKLGVRHGTRRRLLRANQPVARASDYLGSLHCVPFIPEDIDLIKGPARLRRQFLDVTLAPHDHDCLGALQRCTEALTQRNAVLRADQPDPAALAAYDDVLVPAAARVVSRRHAFIDALATEIVGLLQSIPGDPFPLAVGYQPGFQTDPGAAPSDIAAELRTALERSLQRDLRYGQSHVGPHRDDLRLLLDGRPISDVGSEGQCRLAAILIRLAAARVLANENDAPVVLVDDVVGELDRSRRAAFLQLLRDFPQVLVACTNATELPDLDPAASFAVVNGTVTAH
jgi:DNA replication and repair protein RecF